MARYNRVNLDGLSVTETKLSNAALLPATLAVIASGKFVQATAVVGRMYVVHPARHEGGGIDDSIASGQSVVAEYVEENRELAIRVAAGTYAKDTPIKFGVAGAGAIGIDGTDKIIGFSQDAVVLAAAGLIRVRMCSTQKAAV